MISFQKLGNFGRLGNQLFQYAYLRSSARRLRTKFYCPKWDGDDLFDLDDEAERSAEATGILQHFDPYPEAGFLQAAMEIADHTEIQGFFQSERYYSDKAEVRRWYRFKESIAESVSLKYSEDVLRDSVSLSLRIDGDYASSREYFPLYPLSYYEAGLDKVGSCATVLVFADRPDMAVDFFGPLTCQNMRFITGLNGAEQLYLMTRCRANIITNSTFAWWGAWLNGRPQRMIVAPSSWCRPGIPRDITDILCDDWIKVPGTVPAWDHFQTWRVRHPVATFKRILSKLL